MNTQYRKNLKAVLEASKSYCDESINNLKWELGTYDLSVDTNTDTAHIKQLPSGAIQTTVAKVDGVGYKVNQLVANGNFESTSGWSDYRCSFSVSNNEATITISGDYANGSLYKDVACIKDHKYLIVVYLKKTNAGDNNPRLNLQGQIIQYVECNSTTYQLLSIIGTASDNGNIRINLWGQTSQVFYAKNVMCFDLTADFGSGNEPSTVSDCATAYLQRGINIYEYTPQQSSIKNNAFTGATVEGANILNPSDLASGVSFGNDVMSISNSTSGMYILNDITLPRGTYVMSFIKTTTVSSSHSFTTYINGTATEYGFTNINNYTTNQKYTSTFTLTESATINIRQWQTASESYSFKLWINRDTSKDYTPYIQPTTISVDLTTIKDSNNVSLFPSGKMIGNSSVADFITPYNQESKWDEVDLGTLTYKDSTLANTFFTDDLQSVIKRVSNNDEIANLLSALYVAVSRTNISTNLGMSVNTNGSVHFHNDSYSTKEAFKTAMSGVKLQYERATYLTSNTDLTTLTKINAQSNGTITLNNTDNVDMPNTIKTLKEVAK